jgi:dihydrofolate reductase
MKLTATMFLSVDGVVQGPGGPDEDRSNGFERGGWVMPHFDEDTNAFMVSVFERADAFLLGRRTYEIFTGWWPQVTDPGDPIAKALNTLPKHVASTTLKEPEWAGATVIEGELADAVRALKDQPGGELQVHGSPTLVRWLLANDLLDELNLLVFPVVVGDGVRLFPDRGADIGLALADSRTTGSGTSIQVYRPTGRPRYGTVGA